MQRVVKRHGEAADISVTASLAGVDNSLAGWSGRITIRSGTVDGTVILTSALALVGGAMTLAIDTGDYSVGTFIYCVVLTDPSGVEYPTENIQLIINPTATIPA